MLKIQLMKFLLDTNFLLIPGSFNVDIFSELGKFGKPEVYTLDLVVMELKSLAEKKGIDSRSAKLGLKLIEDKKVEVIKSTGKITDLELEKLAEEGYIVCTQDKKLIVRLRKKSLKVVFLRQKKYLEMR